MRIDHEDEPGEFSDSVFEDVQTLLDFMEQPKDERFNLGNWVHRHYWRHDPDNSSPTAYQSFFADGLAPARQSMAVLKIRTTVGSSMTTGA